VVDWFGFRVIATASLPVRKNTLVYGSADAVSASAARLFSFSHVCAFRCCKQAKTVHTKHPRMNSLMKQAGEKLNLKPHIVGNNTLSTSTASVGQSPNALIYGPADIEGHVGTDVRFCLYAPSLSYRFFSQFYDLR
jgi:hypothetical protein